MAVVFFSYSHKDEQLRDKLEVHLALLKGRAMQRHESGEARVIPIVLRPCDWHDAPFGKLTAAPRDGKPISTWLDLDEAFLDVVKDIKTAVRQTGTTASAKGPAAGSARQAPNPAEHSSHPRSSNLRVRKQFTDADKDRHLDEAFEYIAKFFETSLHELEQRNTGLQTAYRRIDADSFTAVVYQDGKSVSECRIARGGFIGNGITYSSDARKQSSGINESLSVEAGDQTMFLKAMMSMGRMAGSEEQQLTFEGAAEYYWSMLIDRLQ